MKKTIIILIITFFVLSNSVLSDGVSDFFKLKKLGELYPDNSFSLNTSENLNISKINGNVSFSLPISTYSMNGYPLDVSINYTGSMSTTSYAYCKGADGYWVKLHQNRPGWIIGVNGIAVQVIAANAMFTCDPNYQLTKWIDSTYTGITLQLSNKDITWMIDGYDVCNELTPLGKGQNQDVIKILKSDGSILEFRNQFVHDSTSVAWTQPKFYTGKYYLNEINSKAYAIVDFDFSQSNLADKYLINSFALGTYSITQTEKLYFQPRLLKYYPGDGYEYTFKEYKMPYGKKPYLYKDQSELLHHGFAIHDNSFGFSYADQSIIKGPLSSPNIFYLYEIKSSVKEITRFEYTKHITPNMINMTILDDSTMGRAFIKSFNYHTFSFSRDYANINAFDKLYTIKYDSVVQDGYFVKYPSKKLELMSNVNFIGASDFAKLSLDNPMLYYSSLGYITKIQSDGIEYKFDYQDYNKKYQSCKFPITEGSYHNILLLNKRLISYESFTNKVEFIYKDPNINQLNTGNIDQLTYEEYSPYLNNYIDSVKYYSKSSSQNNSFLERVEKYNYNFSSPDKVTSYVYSEDFNTYKITTETNIFNKYVIDPYLRYASLICPPPIIYHSNLGFSSITDGINIIKNYTYYCKINPYLIIDTLTKTTINDKNGNDINISKQIKRYLFGNSIPNKIMFAVDTLNNKYGFLLISDTTEYYSSDDNLHNTKINYYQNFLKDSIQTTVIEKTFDKFATIQNYYNKRDQNDPMLFGKRYEDLFCYLAVYRIDTINLKNLYTNELFGVVKNSILYNKQGDVISGISNNLLNSIVDEGSPNFALGKVKSDTIIGNYGILKFNNTYKYKSALVSGYSDFRSSNSTGLLGKSINKIGAFREIAYELDEWMTNEVENYGNCNFGYYGGNKLFNSNDTAFQPLLFREGFDLNSVPIVNASYVRKYFLDSNNVLVLDTVSLVTFNSKNRMGQITQSIDLNGWISENLFDKNGRMKMSWLPGDFHDLNSAPVLRNESINAECNFTTEGIHQYIDYYCHKRGSQITYDTTISDFITYNLNYHGIASNYYVNNPVFECGCDTNDNQGQSIIQPLNNDNKISKGNEISDNKLNDMPILQTFEYFPDSCDDHSRHIIFDESYVKAEFYKPSNVFGISKLDSIILKISIFGILYNFEEDDDIILNVTSERNCIDTLFLLNPSSIYEEVSSQNYYLTIKVDNETCLANMVQQLNDNNMQLYLYVNSEKQGVEFGLINLNLYGDFMLPPREDTDYTLKVDYLDELNMIFKKQKIDDNLHTSNYSTNNNIDFSRREVVSTLVFRDKQVISAFRDFDSSLSGARFDSYKKLIQKHDPLSNNEYFEYDIRNNIIKTTNCDNTFKDNIIEYGNPYSDFGLTHPDFNIFCKKIHSIDEIGNSVDLFYNEFDNLLVKVEDPDDLFIKTQFEYDKFNRLKYVIDPKMDTVKYWYDDFGNIKYKYTPDFGYTSYRYDDLGNLRFSQDQNQADSAKISFFEYDDLNRLMVSGEAKLIAPHLSIEPIANEIHENYTFSRFTDLINPNILNNGLLDILTLNSTLWSEASLDINYCDKRLEIDSVHSLNSYPLIFWKANHILGDSTTVPLPIIYHVNNMNDDVLTYSDESWSQGFENFNSRPKNILNSYYYDDFPPQIGPVWRYIQNKHIWDSLAPKGSLRNTKGKISAMAYRENGKQEFNFMVFSYDERGRVEALLRFTENLGFDGIYYEYNSANQIINTKVIDPQRQFNTWYGYDGAARVDSVWSNVNFGGFQFDGTTWRNTPTKPIYDFKPNKEDFAYNYTKRDQISAIKYPNNLSETYYYNARGWDTLSLFNGQAGMFMSIKNYTENGLVTARNDLSNLLSFPNINHVQNVYGYDSRNQLVWWINNVVPNPPNPPSPVLIENYSYDAMGNRTLKTKSLNNNTDYVYNDSNGPNRLSEFSKLNGNNIYESRVFQSYHSDGALNIKLSYTAKANPVLLCGFGIQYVVKSEEFYYNYLNLTNKYRFLEGYSCQTTQQLTSPSYPTEWRYRFNPFGEREQKRMYLSPLGDTGEEVYPWVYYLLGIDNRQYATYYGVQTSDNGINLSDYTYMGKIEPWRPTTFFYPVEFNVYGNEQAPRVSYKYIDGQWRKQYKFYDYLGSLKFTLNHTGQLINYKTYEAFGDTMLDTLGVTRQGYIGKEKDIENSLGDHGVRKYDYETGRFNSIDPLWEMYMGWTPYQYSMNNPIGFRDGNGLLKENPDGSLKSKSQKNDDPTSQGRYLFTEKSNQKIEADHGSPTNCAGYALTGEFFWHIETPEAMKVIKDEYDKVNSPNDVKEDDVIVYTEKSGKAVHFGRIIEIQKGKDGNVKEIKYQWTDGATSWQEKPNKTSVDGIKGGLGENYGNKNKYNRTYYTKKEGLNKPRELENEKDVNRIK